MFPQRTPSEMARRAMSEAALKLGVDSNCIACHDETKECKDAIKGVVGQKFVKPVSSGNCAIFAAVSATGGKVMIPDQGGWRGFKEYPELLGRELCALEMTSGLLIRVHWMKT
jgi:hypothetical protein